MTTHHADHGFLVADRVAPLHGRRLDGPAPPAGLVTEARLRAISGAAAAIGRLGDPIMCAPLLHPG